MGVTSSNSGTLLFPEFFWFPNNGVEAGYWENCWTDDGLEEEAIDINESVADDYQVNLGVRSYSMFVGRLHLHV